MDKVSEFLKTAEVGIGEIVCYIIHQAVCDLITSYRDGWVWWGGGGIVCTSLCIVVSVSLVGTYKLNVHNHHSVGSV